MNPKLNELATEIDGARSQLLHVVSDVTDAAMNDRPDPDHSSIGEILHPLFLIESQVTTLLQKQILRAKDRGAAVGRPDQGPGQERAAGTPRRVS
jgi:hypothetical protein